MTEPAIQVLLIEDDALLRESLASFLEVSGFTVRTASDGMGFYRALSEASPDVAVVDLGLPDQSGETLVDYLRRNTAIPIVVITARDTLDTRIDCYRIGADLFLGKPVDGRELAAAIRSLAGRQRTAPATGYVVSHAWLLDVSTRTLASPDGTKAELTARECKFIALLFESPGNTIERAHLSQALYGRDDAAAAHALDTLVRRTRQKIQVATGDAAPILTEYGVGYRFTAKVEHSSR